MNFSEEIDTLVLRLQDELHRAWKNGEQLRVEAFLSDHPQLAGDKEALMDLLFAEFCVRQEVGDGPRQQDYLERFPAIRKELKVLFRVDEYIAAEIDPPSPARHTVESELTLLQLSGAPRERGHDEFSTIVDDSFRALTDEEIDQRFGQGVAPESFSRRLGDYELMEVLGRGGMGVVYRARQISLNRMAAVKMIRGGELASEAESQRLLTEAQSAARLKHPAIVAVYEAGEIRGRRYFSMELVEGPTLADLVRRSPMEPTQAARCAQTIAEAIDYAHQMGVLHRDLKPSNVLMATRGDQQEPKITDFGLARQLDVPSGATLTGQILGTPNYMPPEQAQGLLDQIGVPSDVYSLGAVLYEMLTGRAPFQAATIVDILTQVIESPPATPRRLNPALPRDLETICLKCLEKAPHKRYASAGELAEDLKRYLDGRPIVARPTPAWERAAKWARRRPWQTAVGGVVVAATLALMITIMVYNAFLQAAVVETGRQKTRALANEKIAVEQARLAEQRYQRARRSLFALRLEQAAGLVQSQPSAAQNILNDPLRCPQEYRDFTWRVLHRQSQWLFRQSRHLAAVRCVAIDPSGTWLAAGDESGAVKLHSFANADEQPVVLSGGDKVVNAVAFLAQGRVLAAAGEDRVIRLWRVATGEKLAYWTAHTDDINSIAASPTGETLASAGADGAVILWNVSGVTSMSVTLPLPHKNLVGHDRSVLTATFSPDGRRLVSGGTDKNIIVWDVKTGEPLQTLTGHEYRVGAAAFSSDGALLATAGEQQTIRLWNPASGEHLATLSGHRRAVRWLAFSPDGAVLASAGYDGLVALWDVAERKLRVSLRGHDDEVWSVAFAPDGRSLITAGADRTIRWWHRQTPMAKLVLEGHQQPVSSLAFSADSRFLVSSAFDKSLIVWDTSSGRMHQQIHDLNLWIQDMAFIDQRRFLAGADDGTLLVGKVQADRSEQPAALATLARANATPASFMAVSAISVSPDGKLATTLPEDGPARVWQVGSWKMLKEISPDAGDMLAANFDPAGDTLVVGHFDGRLSLWSTSDWTQLGEISAHEKRIESLAVWGRSPYIAAADAMGEIKVFDGATKQLIAALPNQGKVSSLSVSPDGATLATAGADGSLRLWDAVIGEQRAILQRSTGPLRVVRFSRDGNFLAAADSTGAIHLWAPSYK